ncbi:unnamed protein product [Polarella glacialis]|uniref:Uncharacterized protein n=1 Tax=Polarella glacialis TaxID=89957 RepID=A0A813ESU5_POLGL|nr:unnamed protein product [Polarella glacialis]
MAQRPTPSSGLAIGAAAAGGLMILGSSSQAFVSAPAVAASGHNLRASSALAAQSQPAASAAGASVAPVVACTGFAAAALAGQRASRRQNRSSALPTVVPVQSAVQRRALDQSSRYADLSLDEEQLIKNGKYYIDPDNEEMKIAYPTLLFADDPNEMIARGKYVLSQFGYYIDPDNEEMKIAYPTLLFADDPNEMIARGKYVLSQFGYYIDPDNEADDPNEMIARGGGSFGHKDGPKPGAISCRQGEESWKEWKAGKFGDVSLSDGIIEFAKTHEELKGAFLTFQKDADQIYPGWKEKLGYTGESSVQAATFDWAKKAAAAPYIGGWVYAKTPNVEGVYWNEVGYCRYLSPDGTAMNLAGNETNHPEKIKKDMHTPGSTLPISFYMNAVGYLPDGTPLNMAGNNVNHPERIGPDLHKNGSPLPPPLKGYVNDIGYTPDGTPMDKAGNLSVKK